MKNYADKTDPEINALVAMANGLNVQERYIIGIGRIPVVVKLFRGVDDLTSVPCYCNNWEDAGPVILENSITLNYDTAQVHVSSYFNEGIKVSANRVKALRAAMIVFLMMKDNEMRTLAPGGVSDV